jgi:hypothetical protein
MAISGYYRLSRLTRQIDAWMIVLDCESAGSIYESLEAITGAKRDAVKSFLSSIDLNSIYGASSSPRCAPNDFLLDAFKRAFRSDLCYDATCWFHLTRTEENCTFAEGILPLAQRLDPIFDWLFRLLDGVVSKQQWTNFKQAIAHKGSGIYQKKTKNPFHWGPYAILIRDIAFKPNEVRNHDYFSGPEIIEDICFCFEEIYKLDLLKIFLEKTKPCIVKFVDAGTRTNYIRAALWHLHKISWQETCTDYCNDCFDGKAVPVRRDQILSVEFPKYLTIEKPC